VWGGGCAAPSVSLRAPSYSGYFKDEGSDSTPQAVFRSFGADRTKDEAIALIMSWLHKKFSKPKSKPEEEDYPADGLKTQGQTDGRKIRKDGETNDDDEDPRGRTAYILYC